MQWFRNCKTATKLMLGFGTMAALMCLLGLNGIFNMTSVNSLSNMLYERHALGLNYLKEADLQQTMASRSLAHALVAQDTSERERLLAESKNERAAFVSEFEKFQELIVLEQVRAKASVALRVEQQMGAAEDKLSEEIRANQRDRALAELPGLNPLVAQLDNAMRDLENAKLDAMKKADEEMDATTRSARITALAFIAVAVGLAIGLGLMIARIITRPLNQMVDAAAKLAEGEVNQKIVYRSQDELGTLAGVFSQLIETVNRVVAETSRIVEAVSAGHLDRRGEDGKFQGAFRDLVRGLNATLDAFSAPIQEASSALARIAERDLTARVTGDYKGDFATIKNSLNLAVENLNGALGEVSSSAQHVSDTAVELSSASEEIASGAQEQASSLEETASSLEEISSTIKQNAENARLASQLASGSRESAEKGGQVVNAAVAAMGEINQSSKRIADIITTIDEIAFQTNLLALNAAVEAARAGEQGRGFAVVAAEVRNLAQRSASAAKEIKGLIQDSVHKVENGSELVNRSGQTLTEILQSVKRVTDIVAEIAAASQEQATGIEQVNKATMQMDQVTQANSAQTEEMSSTAQALSSSAGQLQALVARFRLSGKHAADNHTGDRAARTPAKTATSKADRKATRQVASLVGLAAGTARHSQDFEEF